MWWTHRPVSKNDGNNVSKWIVRLGCWPRTPCGSTWPRFDGSQLEVNQFSNLEGKDEPVLVLSVSASGMAAQRTPAPSCWSRILQRGNTRTPGAVLTPERCGLHQLGRRIPRFSAVFRQIGFRSEWCGVADVVETHRNRISAMCQASRTPTRKVTCVSAINPAETWWKSARRISRLPRNVVAMTAIKDMILIPSN